MLTLITVNYNCASRTLALLRSLEKQTNTQFSVIVVDNDSRPEDRELLGGYASLSPLSLDVIYSQHNKGFAAGNNLAVARALGHGAEWTLLINPDTEVGPEFVQHIHALEVEPVIWGIPLDEVDSTGSPQGRTAHAGMVRWMRSTLPHLYRWPVLRHALEEPLYAIGGGMLVHRGVWDKLGPMDERYFLYFEDADFGMRARRDGVPVRFLKEPSIRHAVSASTSTLGSPLLLRYHMRNALLFNSEHGPIPARISLHLWAFFTMLKQITKLALMPARRAHSRAILAGITDFYGKRFGNIHQDRS